MSKNKTLSDAKSVKNDEFYTQYAYDHRHRRIRKTVQSVAVSIPSAPSPPSETYEWNTVATHTYVWDGDNIVLERIAFADSTTRVCEYFWGPDMSGAEQGAGDATGSPLRFATRWKIAFNSISYIHV